jgi:hypothetical protein
VIPHATRPPIAPGVHAALVFTLAFANYLLATPAAVMLDDDGYFILAAYFNGVAHPPGYPVYTAAAHIASLVPVGTVAWRVHALSGLFGALACACLWAIARRLVDSSACAYIAALAFAFSSVFWSQAIVAEVYTLNALFLFALMLLALHYAASQPRPGDRRPCWLAFGYGLSLANHWPLMLLSTPGLAALLWPRAAVLLRSLPRLLPFLILGLVPYLWMVLRSRYSEISFSGPIEDLHDFWFYLSRREYRDVDWQTTAGLYDKLRFCGFVLRETVRQFGPAGWLIALLGAVGQWRALGVRVSGALSLIFIGSTFALAGLLGFEYDAHRRNVFSQYPIPAYGIAALWLGVGARMVIDFCRHRWPTRVSGRVLQGALALLLVASTWLANAPANLRSRDNWAERYARVTLETLEPNATFVMFGDYTEGPAAYLHLIEGVRPDVTLMQLYGKVLATRLFHPLHVARTQEITQAYRSFLMNTPTPVYFFPSFPVDTATDFYGIYFRITRRDVPEPDRTVLAPRVVAYLEDVARHGAPADASQRVLYEYLIDHYCALLAIAHEASVDGSDRRRLDELANARCGGYYGLLRRAAVLLNKKPSDPARARTLLRAAQDRAGEVIRRSDLARLEHSLGQAESQLGDARQAARHFARSMELDPAVDNPSRQALRVIRAPSAGASLDP